MYKKLAPVRLGADYNRLVINRKISTPCEVLAATRLSPYREYRRHLL